MIRERSFNSTNQSAKPTYQIFAPYKTHLTATYFWPPGKRRHTFSGKKKSSLIRPIFFGSFVTVLTGFHCNNQLICKTSSAENGTAKILSECLRNNEERGPYGVKSKTFLEIRINMFPEKILLGGRLNKRPASNKRPPLRTLPPPSHNHHKNNKKLKRAFFTVLSASRRMTYLRTLRSETFTRHHQRVR